MNYKIWKQIKIKRVRVPDILCLNCCTRFEARAKTQLEISMSHSLSDPERGWDKGLSDSDIVALAFCSKTGERPIDWQANELIQFVSVGELRRAFNEKQVVLNKPKGAQEGFELRVAWPSAVASSDGVVSSVSSSRIQYKRKIDSRTITLALEKNGVVLQPLAQVHQEIRSGQVIASVVRVYSSVACSAISSETMFVHTLSSSAVSDRYTAVKGLSHLRTSEVSNVLLDRMNDKREHIYVRLEAAAGLARMGQFVGMEFISRTLQDQYLEQRLEAVIILGEIMSEESVRALIGVLLDSNQHAEIRAGAAWALGELQQTASIDALLQVFLDLAEPIRVEAVRALRKIASATGGNLILKLPAAQEDQRAGIAWALSRSGRIKVEDLLSVMVDDDARRWVAYILGMQVPEEFISHMEELRRHDPEVYFAVTVLWKILASWIYRVEEY